jgi:predicted DNA-binding protein YlxM (UPF0122 family)
MGALTLPRHNIKDTRDHYSQVHGQAALGREVVTYNTTGNQNEVSHIDKGIVDVWLRLVPITIDTTYDEELDVYTVSLAEVDIYGEGKTKEEAIDDLLTSSIDYLECYYDRIELYSQYDSVERKAVVAKLARCEGDKESLRAILGV